MSTLFRSEVIEHRRARLCGEVAVVGAAAPWPVILTVLGGFACILATLASSSFARTEAAPGRLVASGAVARVMPTRPGIVLALHVVEGQAVTAGQALAVIKVSQATLDRADPAKEDLAALDTQTALTRRQMDLTLGGQAIEAEKLRGLAAHLTEQLAAIDDQITSAEQIAGLSVSTLQQLTALVEKGFMTRLEFEKRRQELLAQQGSVAQLRGQRAMLVSQIAEARANARQLRATTSAKLVDLKAAQVVLTERRIDAESARGYVITAPTTGRVSGLQVQAGGSVSPQQPLLTIVADGTPLIAELYAPSRARGLAEVGQRVRLNYDAFPYDRYGSYVGRLSSISRTVIDPIDVDPAVALREPVYRLRVTLEKQTVQAGERVVSLQPGMTLNGIIVLERRSFLGWLLEPFYAVTSRA